MTILPPYQLDLLAIDTIRTLAIHGDQHVGSGHLGAPIGMRSSRLLPHSHDAAFPDARWR